MLFAFPVWPTRVREKLIPRSISLEPGLWDRLDAVASKIPDTSRNQLIGDLLEFCVGFFPKLERFQKQLAEIAKNEGGSMAETLVELIEIGLTHRNEKRRKR